MLHQNMDIIPGNTNIAALNTFISSKCHYDVIPQDLSERCGIGIATATKSLTKTMQKFLRSAVLPLGRRYQID